MKRDVVDEDENVILESQSNTSNLDQDQGVPYYIEYDDKELKRIYEHNESIHSIRKGNEGCTFQELCVKAPPSMHIPDEGNVLINDDEHSLIIFKCNNNKDMVISISEVSKNLRYIEKKLYTGDCQENVWCNSYNIYYIHDIDQLECILCNRRMAKAGHGLEQDKLLFGLNFVKDFPGCKHYNIHEHHPVLLLSFPSFFSNVSWIPPYSDILGGLNLLSESAGVVDVHRSRRDSILRNNTFHRELPIIFSDSLFNRPGHITRPFKKLVMFFDIRRKDFVNYIHINTERFFLLKEITLTILVNTDIYSAIMKISCPIWKPKSPSVVCPPQWYMQLDPEKTDNFHLMV